ncbi:MAG: SH3 domain-containing protein [Anaerolineae bacterium]|nr:SH3 domain-containing protein [Anaerolineae bacterium]
MDHNDRRIRSIWSRHRRGLSTGATAALLLTAVLCVSCIVGVQSTPADAVPPTATSMPPTATPVPPTATPIPPTATPVPPTATPVPPTATPVPPTATPVPPTATRVPPTATATPVSRVPRPTGPGTYAVVGVALDDVLNVRAGAGIEHAVVGAIPPTGRGVQVTEGAKEVDGAVWVPVRYGSWTGWANVAFLAQQVGEADEALAVRAATIMRAIAAQDLNVLAAYIHPQLGVRFSPYPYVRVEDEGDGQDLTFSADQLPGMDEDDTVYVWGHYDGSGEPIALTFAAYWERFVYDADFWQPHAIGFGETIGAGNAIDNIPQAYPDATLVEYHLTGLDPQYEGLDWRSLRLVLSEWQGAWVLVGIVHAEWTI